MAAAPLAAPAVLRRLDRRRDRGEMEQYAPSPGGTSLWAESRDGTRIHLLSHGEGGTVVFLVHGWTCNRTIYRYQQDRLKERYRVVTVELRGHGLSQVPASLDYSPDRMAEDLKAAVDLVNPERFVVAGHSMGGFTALRFYRLYGDEYRERLKGLVIIDSSGLPLTEGVIMGGLLKRLYPMPLDRLLRLAGRHGGALDGIKSAVKESAPAYYLVRWGAFGRKPAAEEVELVREMVMSTPLSSIALAAKACIDFDNLETLSRVELPVLLLVGEKDKLTDVRVNRETAALMPQARLVVLPDAGHCTLLEQRDAFNAELEGFLSSVLA
jgi:pimeloyl-ACP methyl ester carboxylesterase